MRTKLAFVLVLLLGGCGGEESKTRAPGAADDPGPIHVHGLGVNPADGALFIATHTGLFRVGEGETKAGRVGGSRQDTMGFTVVGANHFLGSGHPDPHDASTPPHLGLIESRDAGETWRSVSLAGEADFHVLRALRDRVYGVDASTGRFLASADGGRSWEERELPGLPYDLAVHPAQPTRLVATTREAVAVSRDGGRTWRKVSSHLPALLAWPNGRALYALLGDGSVRVSGDAARTWRTVGAAGGEPTAFATDGTALYVALHDGTIKWSRDGGATWAVRSRP